jgi:hypothetical protein
MKCRRLWWAEHVVRLEAGDVYRMLVEKCCKKRPFGRLRRRSEDKIKVVLRETDCEDGCLMVWA